MAFFLLIGVTIVYPIWPDGKSDSSKMIRVDNSNAKRSRSWTWKRRMMNRDENSWSRLEKLPFIPHRPSCCSCIHLKRMRALRQAENDPTSIGGTNHPLAIIFRDLITIGHLDARAGDINLNQSALLPCLFDRYFLFTFEAEKSISIPVDERLRQPWSRLNRLFSRICAIG